MMDTKQTIRRWLLLIGLWGVIGSIAFAQQISGAIWTTDSTGMRTNQNIYLQKEAVYLNGGPAKEGAAGLPEGDYFCRVTDPSGHTILGRTDGAAIHVTPTGEFDLFQLFGTLYLTDAAGNFLPDGATKQHGFADTPNTGGEYKVWISTDQDYKQSSSKTDNFKVDDPLILGQISGFKFHDLDGNGDWDTPQEPGLKDWTIRLTGTLADGTPITPIEILTEADGYYAFTDLLPGNYEVNEVLQPGWQRTSPHDADGYAIAVLSGTDSRLNNFGNFKLVSLCGIKFEDRNGNGCNRNGTDPNDPGLAGWIIELWQDDVLLDSQETDADGKYCFTDLCAGTYLIQEHEPIRDGWKQTAPVPNAFTVIITSDNATLADGTPVVVNGCRRYSLDFGNFKLGIVCGAKFYDANANGCWDKPCEPVISGWLILLTTPDGTEIARRYTCDRGCYVFDNLAIGQYVIKEGICTQSGWRQTYPIDGCYHVCITTSGEVVGGLDFGNLCIGKGDGRTLGFWSNQNGQALINSADLTMLCALNLRTATGGNFDPATYAQLRTWLLNGTATNMAFMLSVQLAAMELNVFNINPATGKPFVMGTALIYAPGTQSANALGFATVQAIMDEANTELGLPGHENTTAAGAIRTYQEALKNALDKANNNLTFVLPSPPAPPYLFQP